LRLGILGGTFDPIHLGHLAAAHAAVECAALDTVLFVPSARPPHRSEARASAQMRFEMCRLAVTEDAKFEASDLELLRGGVSYTVDSLQELSGARAQDQLHLILGWDAAKLFATWHEPARVQQLARIVVVSRPGAMEPGTELLRSAGLEPSRVVLCARPTPDISASSIRDRIAAGQSIAGLVTDGVARYIAAHNLYRDNRQG